MLYWLNNDDSSKFQYAYKDSTLLRYETADCPVCGRRISTPYYSDDVPNLLLEGGRQYPDYLSFCGAGRQMFLLSEKALEIFEKCNVSGYAGYQLIETNDFTTKDKRFCCKYYSLNITGRVDLDMAMMHIKKKRLCAECNQFTWSRTRLQPYFLDQNSWDGSDLCLLTSIPGYKLCTSRVKDIIERFRLTGFSFEPSIR